jgi:hypothetical protein
MNKKIIICCPICTQETQINVLQKSFFCEASHGNHFFHISDLSLETQKTVEYLKNTTNEFDLRGKLGLADKE